MKHPTKNFTQVHNELWDFYVRRLPKFKAEHVGLYGRLRHYFNEDDGYAYPTHYTLALDTGSSEERVKSMLNVLEDSGLVTIVKRKNHYGNDRYIVHDPITDEAEFYKQFPEAKEYYENLLNKVKGRASKDKKRRNDALADEQPQAGINRVTKQFTGNGIANKETTLPQATVHGEVVSLEDVEW